MEFNTSHYQDGEHAGKKLNYVTPGIFAGRMKLTRRVGMSIGGGLQIATTQFYRNNHNGISPSASRSRSASDGTIMKIDAFVQHYNRSSRPLRGRLHGPVRRSSRRNDFSIAIPTWPASQPHMSRKLPPRRAVGGYVFHIDLLPLRNCSNQFGALFERKGGASQNTLARMKFGDSWGSDQRSFAELCQSCRSGYGANGFTTTSAISS